MAPKTRQVLLAERIANGDHLRVDKGELVRSVGYAVSTASKKANELFTSRGVQNALAEMGVTPQKIVTPAIEALNATQSSWYQGTLYKDETAPDHNLRLKAADQLADILGLKKTVVENHNVNVNVDFDQIGHLFEG